ncbi:ribonuclease H-like domain-containing protein [Tanacetum coccineum]
MEERILRIYEYKDGGHLEKRRVCEVVGYSKWKLEELELVFPVKLGYNTGEDQREANLRYYSAVGYDEREERKDGDFLEEPSEAALILKQVHQPLRRSERLSTLPRRYNDFIMASKVKFGLEKFVNYSKLVVQNNWSLFQLDINNAFLYGDLSETVYMSLPDGYFDKNDKRVCKLNKSLYGLKQAPRQWNVKLTHALLENGFIQSKSDYSLFTKFYYGMFLALLVYVDDIIITENSLVHIEEFKRFLKTKFQIKDLGKLKYFFGIEVIETNQGLCLSQRKYCLDILLEFGLLACKPSDVPLKQNLKISNEPTASDPVIDRITEYQKLIRKLIYLAHTRPDISYDVQCLSQFMHKPLTSHLKIALKVLRYLKGSLGKGVHIVRCPKVSLETFVDGDWPSVLLLKDLLLDPVYF